MKLAFVDGWYAKSTVGRTRKSLPVLLKPFRRVRPASLFAAWAAGIFLLPLVSHADTTITLQNSFIEQYKNQATIHVKAYTVDQAPAKPHAPKDDGDMHVAGRAPEIGLPNVAEIMNAASEDDAVHTVQAAKQGTPIGVTGAWRLWCEHPSTEPQVQGHDVAAAANTNPDHWFEIHPLTQVGDTSVVDSFHPIDGYQTKDAATAFGQYEKLASQITPDTDSTQITTSKVGYNYVEFSMELKDDPVKIQDGRVVMAIVRDLDGNVLAGNRRMVFVQDTPPEVKVRDLHKGDSLHVLGIPRIDLAIISWRLQNAQQRPEVLTWNLPYELIVVAVYPE